MPLIQIILSFFFLLAISQAIFRFQKKQLPFIRLIFWLIFWCAAGVVTWLPDSAAYLAKFLGIGRGADLVVYLALAWLFFLHFSAVVKMEKMDQIITRLARELALRERGEK